MSSKPKIISFKIAKSQIDYFKLEKEYLEKNGNVSKEIVPLTSGEYLSLPKHFSKLDLDKKETVVLNFQTGKGKTQLCYDLINEYERKGYYVIVCSPFKKIVEKDYNVLLKKIAPVIVSNSGNIKGRQKKVFNYSDIEDRNSHRYDDFWGTQKLHLMITTFM